MKLFQLKDGYRYNSDSLFLWDFFCRNSKIKAGQNLLDVGCGCGVLALLVARDFECEISAIDIQQINIELCQKNATQNALNIKCVCADVRLFGLENKNSFAKIISNPPFYDFGSSSKSEHIFTSRSANALKIKDFASSCATLLKEQGELFFCYDARFLDSVFAALLEVRLKPVKLSLISSKEPKSPKLALIKAIKGSKTPLEIEGLRYSFLADDCFAPWANEIFKKAGLESVDY